MRLTNSLARLASLPLFLPFSIALPPLLLATPATPATPAAAPAAEAAHPSAEALAEAFASARLSSRIAGYSLSKVQRWLHEVALPRIDAETGLYIADGRWNYRDTAADCYPFLVWAAWAVDRAALEGPVRNVLHAEERICNRVDRIPTPWDPKTRRLLEISWDDLVFQASEYVKDGLIAIVEVTGRDEWFERMKGIEEDLWKHARVETRFGKIPSTNIEVNGEQVQALARLATMTGEREFLRQAQRLADHYLSPGNFVPSRLRDHGCEIIGGLGLLLGVESEIDPEGFRRHRGPIRSMLDEVLRRGVNADGVMVDRLGSEPGPQSGHLSDGWGYDYVGNLCWDLATGQARYRERITATLRNLSKPLYRAYNWEGRHSIDGYADSIEGGIYLLNRVPVREGFDWVEVEMARSVARSTEPLEGARLWGTMKLESNGVRTVLMHALRHTRGATAHPWRRDLRLGAREAGRGLAVVLRAEEAWRGKLELDVPRHRIYMGFRRDWPRMNTLPEWFTVEPEGRYVVRKLDRKGAELETKSATGAKLHAGFPIEIGAGEELRLLVEPR